VTTQSLDRRGREKGDHGQDSLLSLESGREKNKKAGRAARRLKKGEGSMGRGVAFFLVGKRKPAVSQEKRVEDLRKAPFLHYGAAKGTAYSFLIREGIKTHGHPSPERKFPCGKDTPRRKGQGPQNGMETLDEVAPPKSEEKKEKGGGGPAAERKGGKSPPHFHESMKGVPWVTKGEGGREKKGEAVGPSRSWSTSGRAPVSGGERSRLKPAYERRKKREKGRVRREAHRYQGGGAKKKGHRLNTCLAK